MIRNAVTPLAAMVVSRAAGAPGPIDQFDNGRRGVEQEEARHQRDNSGEGDGREEQM
jgi:hypothetical protein